VDAQQPSSVVYASLGSLRQIGIHELIELGWGLVNSRRPFLWVLRPNLVRGSETTELLRGELQEEIRKNGRVVSWAPQQDVLKHPAIGAFLTHCGWNSTLESVAEGVPMICRPLGGDQMGNARYVCYQWKVGVMLAEAESPVRRGDVQVAVERVLGQQEGQEIRKRMRDLKNAAAQCTSKGGSTDVTLQRLVNFIVSP
jgi:UDP-glucosyltransferase BX8/BX9